MRTWLGDAAGAQRLEKVLQVSQVPQGSGTSVITLVRAVSRTAFMASVSPSSVRGKVSWMVIICFIVSEESEDLSSSQSLVAFENVLSQTT